MLMEQMFNSHHIKLAKNERIMNRSFNNQIYMSFFMFANAEYLRSIIKKNEISIIQNIDGDDDIVQYYILYIYIKKYKVC